MRQKANRYPPGPGGAEIYWRRRAIALVVGMAMFGLVAWAVNGTLSSPASTQTASVTSESGQASAGGGGGGKGAAASHPSASASASASRKAAAGRTRAGHGRTAAQRGPGPHGAGQHGAGQHRSRHPGACGARDVVLSLRQPHATYRRGAAPSFTAEVVSTARQPCTLRTGPASVALVIRSGRAPLWSSAYCARAASARSTVLTRGVPVLLHFRWNRTSAAPGCRRAGHPVRPGTYLATAVSGQLSSNSLIFVLRGHGIAVP